jgi:hypothetical protein
MNKEELERCYENYSKEIEKYVGESFTIQITCDVTSI